MSKTWFTLLINTGFFPRHPFIALHSQKMFVVSKETAEQDLNTFCFKFFLCLHQTHCSPAPCCREIGHESVTFVLAPHHVLLKGFVSSHFIFGLQLPSLKSVDDFTLWGKHCFSGHKWETEAYPGGANSLGAPQGYRQLCSLWLQQSEKSNQATSTSQGKETIVFSGIVCYMETLYSCCCTVYGSPDPWLNVLPLVSEKCLVSRYSVACKVRLKEDTASDGRGK